MYDLCDSLTPSPSLRDVIYERTLKQSSSIFQEWKFRKENRTAIYNMAAGVCLVAEEPRRHGAKITMEVCADNLSYMWNLIVIPGEL